MQRLSERQVTSAPLGSDDSGFLATTVACALLVVAMIATRSKDLVLAVALSATGAATFAVWCVRRFLRAMEVQRLRRSMYWQVYADVLEDLAGGDKISDTERHLNDSE